ncbi:MAG: hypothetical protein WCF57_16170 [Pyrinomonadaceae bacterium]
MNPLEQFREIITAYGKHGWRLRRVLMRTETRAQMPDDAAALEEFFEGAAIEESSVDALWFARPSHEGREAWELRHVAATPYALFETFEADEAEEDREDVRREMLARLRERVNSE